MKGERKLTTQSELEHHPFDISKVREDFPILSTFINNKPLIYFDNAATTQKPSAVVEAVSRYYFEANANIHRGVHSLSERATADFEAARKKVHGFLNARSHHEIVFVRGATEAINLVAQSYGLEKIKAGDEILISNLEHHSNIVPWQILCQKTGAILRVIPIHDNGEIDLAALGRILGSRTKLLAVTHVSNALGTITPIQRIIRMAHEVEVSVLVDGAQAVPHLKVDVQALDCDFYVFSGHKLYGPTGIGVLYGKEGLLEEMLPYQGGGDMIRSVTFEKTTYNDLPYKFEAGTPNISGAVGLGAAIDYVDTLGLNTIEHYEKSLLSYATEKLSQVPGLRILGTSPEKAAVISFVLKDVHPHDVGTILDQEGIAIRTGHHCTMPLMERLGVPGTSRASFAFYNQHEEIDVLVAGLQKVREVFG